MPYRRLPNTDAARIRALKAAINMNKSNIKLAYSFGIYQKIQNFLPHFELLLKNLQHSKKKLVEFNKDYNAKLRKAKLYVTHFIKVLNFTIQRGELKSTVRKHYNLDEKSSKLPNLRSENQILKWGNNIVSGEAKRVNTGGNPIYSPSSALVRVNCEKFDLIFKKQKVLKGNLKRFASEVIAQRKIADSIIVKIWNEVEMNYKNLSEDAKRAKCEEYGIVYFYRKGEKRE